MQASRIRKNDKVIILTGKDKGKIGKVMKILRKKDRILVERVNMVKKHQKPNPYQQQAGGIIEKEAPVHASNVMLVCDSCAQPTRIGYRYTADGKKIRFCKKCNEQIGKG